MTRQPAKTARACRLTVASSTLVAQPRGSPFERAVHQPEDLMSLRGSTQWMVARGAVRKADLCRDHRSSPTHQSPLECHREAYLMLKLLMQRLAVRQTCCLLARSMLPGRHERRRALSHRLLETIRALLGRTFQGLLSRMHLVHRERLTLLALPILEGQSPVTDESPPLLPRALPLSRSWLAQSLRDQAQLRVCAHS